MRGAVVEGAMVLRMSWAVDFAYWADIPLEIDTNVAKMVAFKTSLRILQVVLVEQTVHWYSVYSPSGQDLLV